MAHLPAATRQQARILRSTPTEAERTLWRMLKGRRLGGWRFRRQHPAPPYILDFACLEAMVAVEADGGQHNGSSHDAGCDRDLRRAGWRILRFWNADILANPDYVAETVLAVLVGAAEPDPLPDPPPSSTGEGTVEVTP
ncbi:endonuclease domain-containing protein [Azospirillum sp. ST 5-10]|uniref:endonuclease domain-containing protein n=1 Tax=unclassified Azospirillum TaxID=2630922 RepID=UPI003F4A171D